MKNFKAVLCLLLALIGSNKAVAQFNKGRWLAGGDMYLSRTSQATDLGNAGDYKRKITNLEVGPQVAYFILKNLAVGASMRLYASTSNGTTVDSNTGATVELKSKYSSLTIGPFVRYYLPASIFLQAKVDFGKGKTSYHGGSVSDEGKSSAFNYDTGIGYAYFLNDYVALEPMVGYQSRGSKYNDSHSRLGYLYLKAAFTVYLGERK